MKTPHFKHVLRLGAIASAVLIATNVYADRDGHGNGNDSSDSAQVPSGQYVTPKAVHGSDQQFLNPGLPGHPDFVAGEAVRSQLSPDGRTLAIICAGENSLYKPDGTVDTANSTQYIFLYDVGGRDQQHPELKQVIQQPNAYVGLAFAPDGKTLYAAGGNDDVVYAYSNRGGAWSQSAKIALGHNGKGVGIGVQDAGGGQQLQRLG
jgi:WD40 repeat protein